MKWYTSQDGKRVDRIELTNPADRFADTLIFKTCPDDVEQNYFINADGTFSAPSVVVEPPAVPQSVSMVQAQLALQATPSPTNAGKTLLDDVNAAVDAMTDPRAKIAWTRGTVVERTGLLVTQIASNIPGLNTSEERDALFIAAAKIVT